MSRRVKTRLGQFCGILVGGTMDLSHSEEVGHDISATKNNPFNCIVCIPKWRSTPTSMCSRRGIRFNTLFPTQYKPVLREIKLCWEDQDDGTVHYFDGFAHDTDLLDHLLPAVARLPVSFDNAFLIDVRDCGCNCVCL